MCYPYSTIEACPDSAERPPSQEEVRVRVVVSRVSHPGNRLQEQYFRELCFFLNVEQHGVQEAQKAALGDQSSTVFRGDTLSVEFRRVQILGKALGLKKIELYKEKHSETITFGQLGVFHVWPVHSKPENAEDGG